MKGDFTMTLGTFGAGLAIVAFTLLIELVDTDNKKRAEEFLKFE